MTEEVIRVRVQKMFPNCSKYTHCCDESWHKELEMDKTERDYIKLMLKEVSKRDISELRQNKPPEDFSGY